MDESKPLLLPPAPPPDSTQSDGDNEGSRYKVTETFAGRRMWRARLPGGRVVVVDVAELADWWRLTWTTGFSQLLRSSPPFIDIAFLGHLGTEELAAASAANVLVSMTSMWLWAGQEEVISTLTSQAVGHKNHRLAGTWLQMAAAVSLVLGLPVAVTWVFSDAILTGVGFGPASMTAAAQVFSRWFLLTLAPLLLFSAASAWLNAVGHTSVVVGSNVAGVAASIGANYLLIWGTTSSGGSWPGLGFIGSPISSGIAGVVALTTCVVWVRARGLLGAGWPGLCPPELRRSRNWSHYLGQALPNFLGAALETLQIQIMSTLAARVGEAQLATHNAMLSLYMVITCFMFGAIRATTLTVGRSLGARSITLAKQHMWVCVAAQTALGVVTAAVLYGGRDAIPRLFSDDPDVWRYGAEIMGPVAASLLLYSVMFSAIGVLLGQGRPGIVAACVFVGNWTVAVPLAFLLAHYTDLGLIGIWIALLVGYAVVTAATLAALLRSDWQAAVLAAVERSRHEDEAADTDAAATTTIAAVVAGELHPLLP